MAKENLEFGSGGNKTVFTKTGDTVLTIDKKDSIYLDVGETITITTKLENTYNLKIDVIDDVQSNFKLQIETSGIVNQNDKTLTALQYGKTKGIITHIPTGRTKEVEIRVVAKMQSIVQGFRDIDLDDGTYSVNIEDEVYDVELINYYDDMIYSKSEGEASKVVELGDSTQEKKMLVVKYHKNLKIEEGVTLTAKRVR